MPIQDWHKTNDNSIVYHKNYIYINGHTHKNTFYDDGEIRIYADNQIGYYNTPHLKWLSADDSYDYFVDYKDGIYIISKNEYKEFYRGKNISMQFNREINIIYMLKKNEYYCFIHQSKNGKLCILNGGVLNSLSNNDINYYYENIDLIINTLKAPIEKYTKIQNNIANEIKKLGGFGIIHGCIIDIDFYNHIYVNPDDLKLTAYYALDIIDKTVYSSIPALLEKECPILYNNYIKLLKDSSSNFSIINKTIEIDTKGLKYYSTDIYKASRVLCKMKKINSNILTVWGNINVNFNLLTD